MTRLATRLVTWLAQAILIVVLASIALPSLYATGFAPAIAPTYLFYSPVIDQFVYREHHGNHDFVYESADGASYDRQAFEKLLPFIYYKNMDIWGLLPIELDGQSFDVETIRDARQVFELKARTIADRRAEIPVYALLNAAPERAGLSFPEDVFRMTDGQMEFVNVDTNRVDPQLTARFTNALTDKGFSFPARLVAGRQTILKPFDAGVFIVDATGAVFHVMRKGDAPEIVKTPIPADLDIRHIKVSENKKRKILAMVLTKTDRLFLMRMPDYSLIEMPTKGYDPDSMDYKLILNPLGVTATFDDNKTISGVTMTPDFVPVADCSRPMPTVDDSAQAGIARVLFPFTLSLAQENGTWLRWKLTWSGWASLLGIALSLVSFAALYRHQLRASWRGAVPALILVAVTGLFGLLAVIATPRSVAVG